MGKIRYLVQVVHKRSEKEENKEVKKRKCPKVLLVPSQVGEWYKTNVCIRPFPYYPGSVCNMTA